MKFGARYEILRALTRGDVETFAVRDRTTDEKALAHIFECPEPPLDQPTVQWILASFSRLVSEAPGIVTGAGKYDVAGFAYVVSRWTTDEEVEEWVRHQKYESSSDKPGSAAEPPASPPEPKPQAAAPTFTPEAMQAISDSSLENSKPQISAGQPGAFTQQFFGGIAFPGDSSAAEKQTLADDQASHSEDRPIASSEAESSARLGEPLGETSSPLLPADPQQSPLRSPGNFTAQFFREINAPLEPPAQTSAGFSAEGKAKPEFRNEAPTPSKPAVGAGSEDRAGGHKPGSFTDQFMRDFGPAIPSAQPDVAPAQRPAKTETGEFTKLFNTPVLAEQSKSESFDGRMADSKSGTGEFTRMFGPHRYGTTGEAGFPARGGEGEPAATRGASGELFGGHHAGERSSVEEPYSPGPRPPGGQFQDGGATHAFAARREFPERPEAAPVREPLTSPVVSNEPILDSHRLNSVDGGATVLFRAPAEAPTPGEPEQPAGPSDYTMFMNKEALSALVSGAPDAASLSGAPQSAPPAAAPSPALTPPVVAPPAMPSYQPPAMPGGSSPAMPSVAAPAIAAPSVPAPAGQASGKPKSNWPLIIILNVLFILAVLLILYFALKH